ncbi:histone acetyltransferase KAT2A [Drosophila grimshawi]|uniref:GH24713 n=1 Tax=Drosophila grimshawi TaxID=7222 RepID=B4JMY6_DROGR|nr:histone acetyltransferase KAT2A [Drosophila grimshawi]EDV92079.1 GH24713 [Drosophila grimshawi]
MIKGDPMWGGNWCESAEERQLLQFHNSDPDDLSMNQMKYESRPAMSTKNDENEPPVVAAVATCCGVRGAPQMRLPLLKSPNKANTANNAVAVENLSNIANDFITLHLFGSSMAKPLDTQSKTSLLALQSIFMGELSPRMPPEYISDVLFDPTSKTLALVKRGQPIGGICFVSFPTQGFIEIVFCAIVSSEQLKGHGGRLMGHMKDYVLSKSLRHLLTYASGPAIGFFRKQSFCTHIRLAGTIYENYIPPAHNGATLMHCELHPTIATRKFKSVVRKQQQVLKEMTVRQENAMQDIRPIASIPALQEIGCQPDEKKEEAEVNADPHQIPHETAIKS